MKAFYVTMATKRVGGELSFLGSAVRIRTHGQVNRSYSNNAMKQLMMLYGMNAE